jgi:hypothetical protein
MPRGGLFYEMNINMKNNSFAISDFTSACVIRALGINLLRLERTSPKTVTFVYSADPSTCEQILKDHWDRKLKVETRALFEIIAELKTRVHQELNQKP